MCGLLRLAFLTQPSGTKIHLCSLIFTVLWTELHWTFYYLMMLMYKSFSRVYFRSGIGLLWDMQNFTFTPLLTMCEQTPLIYILSKTQHKQTS